MREMNRMQIVTKRKSVWKCYLSVKTEERCNYSAKIVF